VTDIPAPAEQQPSSAFGRWKLRTTAGAPLFPLVVLFGLNAVDELDRTAFGVLLPNIRDDFHLDTSGILAVVALAALGSLLVAVPIGFYADRLRRVRIATLGGIGWGGFSVLTGLATSVWMLGVARAGSGIGRGINDPVHNSLIADYYDIPVRPRVYSIHRMANAVGQFAGPLLGGLLAFWFDWRVPFFVFAVPTIVFILLSLRLREPKRGVFERRAMGASEETVDTEDIPPSWAESWRLVWSVRTLRRVFYALPFLALSIIGLLALGSLLYEQAFDLDEKARGFVAAGAEPAQIVGLIIGIPIATRLMTRNPALLVRFIGVIAIAAGAVWAAFALAPNLPFAIAMNVLLSGGIALVAPGVFAALSLTIPPKVRAFGFAVAGLWVVPGLIVLPLVGALADEFGIRTGLLVMVPVFVIGGLILASVGSLIDGDIRRVWTAAAAQSEALYARRHGESKLLVARSVDVAYDGVQVLFGVDFEVDEGEIVALLGTNGAGKSTLLRAIGGLAEPSNGAIVFDGRDITHTPPDEIAKRGIATMPGGQGTFPSLTVHEHLRLAAWTKRGDTAAVTTATEGALEHFPVLRERMQEPAGNLSGGQQQMLTLAMAFIAQPKLLMIDELSLGLAPTVVAQLLPVVREFAKNGTTIILVEQSVNLALQLAQRAYFMEKGEIRFEGATADLLERDDILRSVFLEGATAAATTVGASEDTTTSPGGSAPEPRPGPKGQVFAPQGRKPAGARVDHGAATGDDGVPSPTAEGPDRSVDLRLQTRAVTKRFGGIVALDGVSFELNEGEILGILGPNGAGKTTLFDVINGFEPMDSGEVLLRDRDGYVHDITRMPADARSRHGLGRSFQDGRLFPALTVAETIAVALEDSVDVKDPIAAALHLPAVIDSEEAVSQRVEELIELLGLEAFRDKFVRELSTGSRRVVDLACVIAHRPQVVLLDEPSSGIAQREAEALAPMLLRIRDELGASVLLIEHDLPLLRAVADRLLALDLGTVIAQGAPDEVVHDPRVVASYLGTDEAVIARSGARGE
jgi:branched-chain amino acid transport system ATP-binding protein